MSAAAPGLADFELDDLATPTATSRRGSHPSSTADLNPTSLQAVTADDEDDEDPAFHSSRRSGDRPREFPAELPPMVRPSGWRRGVVS